MEEVPQMREDSRVPSHEVHYSQDSRRTIWTPVTMCVGNLIAWMAKKRTSKEQELNIRIESRILLWGKRVDLLPGRQQLCKIAKSMLSFTDLHSTSNLLLSSICPDLRTELDSARHSTKRTYPLKWEQASRHMEIYSQSKDHHCDRNHQPVQSQPWRRPKLITWRECLPAMRAIWTRATSGWRRVVIE